MMSNALLDREEAHSPQVPPQGRWRTYGVNLPETILRKVYFENAARQLKVVA